MPTCSRADYGRATDKGESADWRVPPTPALKRRSKIDHIAIVVEHIPTAVQWYLAHFNCLVQWQDSSWAYLEFENCGLALVVDGTHPSHFAVQVDGFSRFGTPSMHRDGTRFLYLQDCDGNTVEMLDRTSTEEVSK